jgi:CRISPR/Cas system-associated endonuclease/helicase Cas3
MAQTIMLFIYLLPYVVRMKNFGERAERGFSKHGVREEMHRIKSYLTENKQRGHVRHGKERNRGIPKTLPLMFHKMWLLQA